MRPHLACRVFGTPLLIAQAKLDVILSVLAPRLGGAIEGTPTVLTGALAPLLPNVQNPLPHCQPINGIAVIPIHGTLVKRTLGLEAASGLMSYAAIAGQLDAALADPLVSGIVLDMDSAGGEASGVFELGRQIRQASGVKPVWAVANDSAFSAAYALAASADRLYLTETAGVGSIGVIALHRDQSARDAAEGLRYTAVTAGAHKDDYSPHAPLSPEAQSSLQAEVDRLYGLFVEHVATMRQLNPKTVRSTEAGLYFGEQALAAGLADGIQSLTATISGLQAFLASKPSRPLARPAAHPSLARAGAASALQEITMLQTESPSTNASTLPPALTSLGENPMGTNLYMQSDQPVATQAEVPAGKAKGDSPVSHPQSSTDLAASLLTQARSEAAHSAQAIAELCLLANCPLRAAEFIAAGHTEAQVRRTLIEARAAASDAQTIQSALVPPVGSAASVPAPPETSPIVAAVKKLTTTR